MHSKLLLCLLGSFFCMAARAGTKEDLDAIILPQLKHGDLEKVMVGITDGGQRSYFNYGTGINENSIFEIGSITKTFTGLSLGVLAARGTVQLDDPIAKYLPELSTTDAGKITLLQLSTHTSGLERVPSNLMAADRHCSGPLQFDATNPYAQYQVENLICYLKHVKISSKPTQFSGSQYSNTGVETLAIALARADGLRSFSELVQKNILAPLALKNTAKDLNRTQIRQVVVGRTEDFEPAKPWTFDQALGGAGSLHSTAHDLLTYLEAQISPPKPMEAAVELSRQVQKTGTRKTDIGLNWLIQKNKKDPVIWHNGNTGGFYGYTSFQVDAKKGAVVLSNSENPIQCLEEYFLGDPCKIDFGFPLSDAEFTRLVGTYQVEDGSMKIQIFRKSQALFVRANGVSRLKPISATHFSFTSVDAILDVNLNTNGSVQSLLLTQDGQKARFIKQ